MALKSSSEIDEILNFAVKTCALKNIKLTNARLQILQSIVQSTKNSNHPDIDEIYMAAKSVHKSIGVATVYRFIAILSDIGVLEKHNFYDGRTRYEIKNDTSHHDHLIDSTTGKVVEFYDQSLEDLKTKIAYELGYKLIDHKLELIGVPLPSKCDKKT